jgi:hypothetical protein
MNKKLKRLFYKSTKNFFKGFFITLGAATAFLLLFHISKKNYIPTAKLFVQSSTKSYFTNFFYTFSLERYSKEFINENNNDIFFFLDL